MTDYHEQFKVGRQELLNILDIQSELYSAQTKLIDATYNIDTSAYRLVGIQGRLTGHILSEEAVAEYLAQNPERDEPPSDLLPSSGLPQKPAVVISTAEPTEPLKPKPRLRLNPFSKK